MIELLKARDTVGWWIKKIHHGSVKEVFVTAQEVLDLLNQIKEQQKELLKEI